MKKYYLMAPGPSMIPEKVLLKMAEPIIHHRTKGFEAVLGEVREKLKKVFQTKNEVLLLGSVGSGGMEAALVNCLSPGDKIIAIVSGKFGERWRDQAKTFGLNVIELNVPWGQAVAVSEVKKLLDQHNDVKAVLCQACETSTGVYHPVKELGDLIHKYANTLLMVDAITALGITDIRTDEWHLDVVVTGSQKALMLPPGLAMICLSDKAWKMTESSSIPKYYFNLREELKMIQKNQTHFTPAISLIQGLNVSLGLILDEGLPELFARHKRLAHATREALKAMGLELFSKAPSDSITAVCAPSSVDGEKLVSHMYAKYNVQIIGGQDQVKGKVFRLGHMGYCSDFDVVSMIAATEMTLKDLGYKFELGVGVAKALQTLHHDLGSSK